MIVFPIKRKGPDVAKLLDEAVEALDADPPPRYVMMHPDTYSIMAGEIGIQQFFEFSGQSKGYPVLLGMTVLTSTTMKPNKLEFK